MKQKFQKLWVVLTLLPLFGFSQNAEKIDSVSVLDQRVTTLEDALTVSKKLKISGYVQMQWQSSQIDSLGNASQDMKVGAGLGDIEKRAKATDFNRMGVRRGRIKLAYEDFGCTGVLQFDLTEKGLGLKDAYLSILDPWVGYVSVKGGVFDRPFGYEISYSSSRRESPERSRIFQTLFPDERDLGAMLTIQAPKTSPLNVLKLEAGLFAGNGINTDNDSKKDFIGHLTFTKSYPSIKYAIGASYYNGYIAQLNKNIYHVDGGKFLTATGDSTGFSKRQYYGFDAQLSLNSVVGLSTIRAEYLFGLQPGSASGSGSPSSKGQFVGAGTAITDTYLRNFSGGYIHFIQDIADTKHSIVLKYDWYDPNTKIAGNQIIESTKATTKLSKADMAYSTIGLGYMYRMNNNIRIMAYYDMVSNEKVFLKGYIAKQNLADNLVTVRVQYKF